MPRANVSTHPYVRPDRTGTPKWKAKWSLRGESRYRTLGPAWMDPDGQRGWVKRKGRPPEGWLSEQEATARMLELVADHDRELSNIEAAREERRRRGVTFRELAGQWLEHLERERGAKPSTVRDYRLMLTEQGSPHRRGQGTYEGLLMGTFGDRPVTKMTTREVSDYLRSLDKAGKLERTVNKHRQLLSAVFNYGLREDVAVVTINPVRATTKRREQPAAVIDFYEPEEIEAIARAAHDGKHRATTASELAAEERGWREVEDHQDAELIRIAGYTGLRLGELLALRWQDVNLQDRILVVHRALSAGVEGPTKSWQARFVPLADPAAEALARLGQRGHYTSPQDYVFVSRLGRRIDPSALRKRFKKAAVAAEVRQLRFHALRHSAGSLIARETDARWVQGFLGHSKLATTERYLHAKPRPQDVERLNRAFGAGTATRSIETVETSAAR
jgi:integrase